MAPTAGAHVRTVNMYGVLCRSSQIRLTAYLEARA